MTQTPFSLSFLSSAEPPLTTNFQVRDKKRVTSVGSAPRTKRRGIRAYEFSLVCLFVHHSVSLHLSLQSPLVALSFVAPMGEQLSFSSPVSCPRAFTRLSAPRVTFIPVIPRMTSYLAVVFPLCFRRQSRPRSAPTTLGRPGTVQPTEQTNLIFRGELYRVQHASAPP